MENGWMDWIEWMWMWKVESGKWRGSGSHTCQCSTVIVHQWIAALLEQWRRLFEVVGHLQFYMLQKNKKAVIVNAET